MRKAILFDLDGVVIDSEPLYQKGEERLFREFGIEVPEEDWKLFRGSTEEKFYQLARERYGIQTDHRTLKERGRKYVLEEFDQNLDYMPGFVSLMQRIRQQYKIGLVTATPEDIFRWIDRRLDVSEYFPHVIWGGMTKNGKPHPEPYVTMMDTLSVQPGETIVVEDSLHGIHSGLNSGASVIAVTGSIPIEDIPVACTVVNSLDGITDEVLNSL